MQKKASPGKSRVNATTSPNALQRSAGHDAIFETRVESPDYSLGQSPVVGVNNQLFQNAETRAARISRSHLDPEGDQFADDFDDHVWAGKSREAAVSRKIIHSELGDLEAVQFTLDE